MHIHIHKNRQNAGLWTGLVLVIHEFLLETAQCTNTITDSNELCYTFRKQIRAHTTQMIDSICIFKDNKAKSSAVASDFVCHDRRCMNVPILWEVLSQMMVFSVLTDAANEHLLNGFTVRNVTKLLGQYNHDTRTLDNFHITILSILSMHCVTNCYTENWKINKLTIILYQNNHTCFCLCAVMNNENFALMHIPHEVLLA